MYEIKKEVKGTQEKVSSFDFYQLN